LDLSVDREVKLTTKKITLLTLALFVFSASLFAFGTIGEGKYEALVGDFEFDFQGQIMIITFSEEDGKLMAAPEGQEAVEIEPVEGEEMKFDVTTPEGQYYEIIFAKDDSGEVNLCTIITMGMEIEGVRVKE
jgi:hypothetical protein